jgi:hypothetical protein
MRLTWRVVAQQEGRALVLAHQDIQIAIAIVIAIGSAAAYQELIQTATGWRHNFHKLASAEIAEELRWLGTGNVAQTGFVDHMAVHHEQIFKAVQVCIKEKQPERHIP